MSRSEKDLLVFIRRDLKLLKRLAKLVCFDPAAAREILRKFAPVRMYSQDTSFMWFATLFRPQILNAWPGFSGAMREQ